MVQLDTDEEEKIMSLHLRKHVDTALGYQPWTLNGYERKITESWQQNVDAVLGTADRWLHQCIADTEAKQERKLSLSETLRLLDRIDEIVKDNGERKASALNLIDELRTLMQDVGLLVS